MFCIYHTMYLIIIKYHNYSLLNRYYYLCVKTDGIAVFFNLLDDLWERISQV